MTSLTVGEKRKRISVVEGLGSGELAGVGVSIPKIICTANLRQMCGLVEGSRSLVLRMARSSKSGQRREIDGAVDNDAQGRNSVCQSVTAASTVYIRAVSL